MFSKLMKDKEFRTYLKMGKIAAAIFVVLIAVIVFTQRVSQNSVSIFGIQLYTIITESMEPAYQVYDMLLVRRTNPDNLNIGDDITYVTNPYGNSQKKTLTHRIIRIEEDDYGQRIFITKGIANLDEDPPVHDEQILGKVIYSTVFLTFLSRVLNNIYGFYFLIFVPMVVLIFLEVISEINHRKKRKE